MFNCVTLGNMNPPFRALDVWDVFLDALNRKNISTKLLEFWLTKLVSRNSLFCLNSDQVFCVQDYQFILISPQGPTDITCDASEHHRVSIMEVKKS